MTKTEQLQQKLKRIRAVFLIAIVILMVPFFTYLNAILLNSREVTVMSENVKQDNTKLIPTYKAMSSYNVWVLSGEYDIKITKREYEKALKEDITIREVNYNSWGAESKNHATWTIMPYMLAVMILIVSYKLYCKKLLRRIN